MNISKIAEITSPTETDLMHDGERYYLTNLHGGWQLYGGGGRLLADIQANGIGFRGVDSNGDRLSIDFKPLPAVIHQALREA